jgi:hypothetical protein
MQRRMCAVEGAKAPDRYGESSEECRFRTMQTHSMPLGTSERAGVLGRSVVVLAGKTPKLTIQSDRQQHQARSTSDIRPLSQHQMSSVNSSRIVEKRHPLTATYG